MATYLFDFDGTLVDSMDTYAGVMLSILDKNGIKYGKDIVKVITPLGYLGTANHFIGMGVKASVLQLVCEMKSGMVYEYTHNVGEKPNVISTLKALKEKGDSLNILTASPHEVLDPCLKRLGIFELFDNVWSCDDFETTKANPEIYKMAAKKMGVAVGDAIFLDDNYNADLMAKRAGAKVVGVYDESSADYEGEIRGICDAYIRDFYELIDLKL